MQKVRIFTRFERFWHWTQMALVLLLTITGFEVHGNYELLGYETSVRLHNSAAWAFMGLGLVSIFYMLASRLYKNFIPTTHHLKEQVNYYTTGIFRNEKHSENKSMYNKLNPLQRLVYGGLLVVVFPVQIVTGVVYLFYQYPQNPVDAAGLKIAALTHTMGAFLMVAFVMVHIYMTTTGNKITTNIKSMITGFDEKAKPDKNVSETIENF
jgi:thiosulfate reductase cytochrome b subunit